MPQDYDHTVVVGGDIAGLLAARVLADHATRVSLLDRDRLPAAPAFHPGVSQARHLPPPSFAPASPLPSSGRPLAVPFPAPFRRSRSMPPAEAPHRLGSTVKPLCSFGFAQALFEQNA